MIFMIKAISNLTNHTTMHTTHVQAPTPAGSTTIFSRTRSLRTTLRLAASLVLLLFGSVEVTAQDLYVIHNGDNYLSHNATTGAVNTTATTFSPTTCFWTISGNYLRPVNSSGTVLGNLYLRPRSGNNTYSLNTNTSTNYASWNGLSDGGQPYYSRYLRLNGTTWQVTNTNSNRGTLRLVTVTSVTTTSTNPTINGANALTAIGNSTYTASGAAYQSGYTNYYFNSANHYADGSNNTISPAAATIGSPTWNLTTNSNATVNSSSGIVNVSSLPANDITLTLTVTYTVTGGTPTAPANTTLSASKEITLYGTTIVAPTITRSGNNISLSTSSVGATIYYTTDGSAPSANNGTAYDGPFSIERLTFPVTVKAITIRNGNTSSTTTQTYNSPACEMPQISISTTGAVTISCPTEDATIRYTTDGTDPTESTGTVYSGTFNVSNLTTVKAIAYMTNYTTSAIATDDYITSGTDGIYVVLDDREDHNWSYYQASSNLPTGYPDELHSPDPRNVKITYKGNGQYTNGTAVSGVKVGIDADASTFVYYKTLEKGTDGKYAYTTIPNPFSVRPKNNDTYYGFSHWKVTSISGGSIEGNPTTINADTEIKFIPTGNYTTNCTSIEVVMEAVWDVAEVSTSGTFTNNYGVERMFYVVPTGNSNLSSANKACTYSSFYPNGTTNGTTAATLSNRVTRYSTFSATYDSKIEYIILRDNNSTLNANGKNFTIGRGVSGYNNGVCATNLYGLSESSTTSFKFRIESGTYTNLYFLGKQQNFTNNAVMTTIMGCDYDRAKVASGDNSYNEKLHISDDIALGYNSTAGNSSNKGAEIFHCTVKSGNYDLGTSNYGGDVQFYLSVWGNNNATYGKRTLIVEGGIFSDISGGTEDDGTTNVMMVDMRIKGGTMNSAVYGAAQKSGAEGHRRIIITGGNFKGWIAGGANGNATGTNANGEMTGNSYIYVGGNATVNSGNSTVINRAVGGNVFGAGCGYGSGYSSGLVTGNTNVAIADSAYIERGVYGGGSYGYTTQTSNIYILGGTIACKDGGVNGTSYLAAIDGGVYGGACQNQGGTVNIIMNGGTVNGSVYGGSNYTGTLSGTSTVTLNGGTINGSLYGGGNGEGSSSTNVTGAVAVNVYGGTVTGAVYGCNNNQGAPQSTVNVDIYGTDPAPSADAYAIAAVYGGGNQANYASTPVVTVHGCDNSIEYVYGGGNAATVRGTSVTIYGGNKIGNVFGGCYGANVTNDGTIVNIYGGTIEKVFGGSNSSGTITGSIRVNINKQAEPGQSACSMHIGEVYGGGNVAGSAAGTITVGCTGSQGEGIGDLYGGANQAPISSNITLNITGGSIDRIFGGNNASGAISGNIIVNVDWKTGSDSCGYNYIGSVFGGGNQAPYNRGSNNYPQVNIYNARIAHNVFGGGLGATAIVTGNPQVTIGSTTNGKKVIIGEDVYGGGDAAAVSGTPVVTVVNNCNDTIGNVYGGGNAADVTATNVTINGGNIGMVFGGGHGDKNSQPQKEANVSGAVNLSITGGTIQKVFGGSNSKGNIDGKITISVNKGDTSCEMHIDELYGGGNEAEGNAGDISIGCTGGKTEGIGDVYGGANAAGIKNDIKLDITGGNIQRVFGGNNASGSIDGTIEVNVNWKTGNEACGYNYLGSVFGGGNLATYSGTPTVNIKNGTVSGNVFGGGHGDPDSLSQVPGQVAGTVVNIGDNTNANNCAIVVGNVYGGGNAAKVTGKTKVTYNDTNTNSYVAGLFGGGNAANVGDSTIVTLTRGKVTDGVYGGCDSIGSVGNVKIALNGGQVGASGAGKGADVYGGGYGSATTTTGNIGVILNGATVYGDIYGGSALGQVNGSTSHTSTVTLSTATLHGSVFGGGKGDSITTATSKGNATVIINAASTDITGIYGGANIRGLVKGAINVNVNANVGASGNSLDIFGGGYGAATNTEGNVTVTIGNVEGTITPLIYGDIYGGSALGNVNNDSLDVTTVNFLNGTLHGNIYGGGLGDKASLNTGNDNTHSDVEAKEYGKVVVNISNTTQTTDQCKIDLRDARIYGCNNTNGSPQADVEVHIYKTAYNYSDYTTGDKYKYTYTTAVNNVAPAYAIKEAFGGGNQANYAPEDNDPDSEKKAQLYIHGCTNTIERVFGGGNAAAAVGLVTTIDGGRFDYVFGGGNGEDKAANIGLGGTNLTVHGGSVNKLFGGSNEQGTISGTMGVSVDATGSCASDMYIAEFFCGNNLANIGTAENPVNINATIGCDTKFGDVYGGCNLADIIGNITLNVVGGEMNRVFGGSKGQIGNTADDAADIDGNVTLNITGGKIGSAFGGSNVNGNITGSILVNVEKAANPCVWQIGDVYGASNDAAYTPTKQGSTLEVYIKNGTIGGNVFGGGKGPTATAKADPQVTIGDTTTAYVAVVTGDVYGGGDAAEVVGTPAVLVINKCNTSIGNVYGGGNAADVSATSVTINGGTITGDVFGGGHGDKASLNVGNETGHSDKTANVGGDVTVLITGGTINRVFGGSNTNGSIDGGVDVTVRKETTSCEMHITELYGGGNMANGNAGTITIVRTGGATEGIGDVYGGANQANIGTEQDSSNIALSITGGSINNVFGGNNTSGTIYGTIQVDVNISNNVGTNRIGNVYGGGNLAVYSGGPVVNILNGTVSGNVFGGGNGDPDDNTQVPGSTGAPTVTIGDITSGNEGYQAIVAGDVYGGGNAAKVTGSTAPTVLVQKCNTSVNNVYGGGNAADVPATNVTINGGTITHDVFGGGHGDKASLATQEDPDHTDKAANVGGDVAVLITGGTINRVFGGSNTNGNITGDVDVTVRKETTSCEMHITELYGGGNMADGNAGTITIVRTGGQGEGIGSVFGGANRANIGTAQDSSDIALTITGGSIDNVFGGNNNSGIIYGDIQVNVNISNQVGENHIGNVYGGGNLAPYSNPGNYPEVNIKNGTVSGNVFGGGYGEPATVAANPKVTLTGGTVTGNVFGGGDAAPVTGNPVVLANGNAKAAKLYGGGKGSSAAVSGFTTVTVNAGTYDYVFGGGEEAGLSRSATVNIAGGTINNDVYGGGALAHTNTANLNTTTGEITISTDTTKVNLTGGTVHNVYGGGLGDLAEIGTGHTDVAALVYGNVLVNLNQGVASGSKGSIVTGNVFGCNNINGTPKGSVTVHVYGTQNPHVNTIGDKSYEPFEFDVAAIYGGGNMAAYIPASATPTHVTIEGCGLTSIGYVYGGGNAAPVPATDVTIMGSDTIYSVFGGGNGKDRIMVGNQEKDNPGADVGIRQIPANEYVPNYQYNYTDPKYTTGSYYVLYGDITGSSIIGTTTVTILGGTVGQLFGGSNTKGDIVKEAKVLLGDEDLKTCEFNVGGVYGGSNEAYMSGSADIMMRCMDGMAEIYGGSRMADVSQDIVLTITGGHYNKVFGGNNLSGRIYGSITINIQQTGCLPIQIDELYGGGNQAPYSIYGYKSTYNEVTVNGETVKHYELNAGPVEGSPTYHDPVINIVSCDSIGKVYGGGLEAAMVGSPHIYVDMVKGWTDGSYTGQKPGVSDSHAAYANKKYQFAKIGTIDTIFGGGNRADVTGNSYIFIGTQDSITVYDVKKAVYDSISIGRTDIKDPAFADNADSTDTKDLRILVEGANITGNIYGGGNRANVTGKTYIKVGPDGQTQELPASNQQPAPARPAPPRATQPATQPATPQTNAATQSDQTRSANLTRQ